MGGSAKIRRGAHVFGRATTIGGSLEIDDDARVDGDIDTIGGSVKRGNHAVVGGNLHAIEQEPDKDADESCTNHFTTRRILENIGDALTSGAMLFVFGALLIAMGTRRMETVRAELARPGSLGRRGFVAMLACAALLIVLCVTLIGIPAAIVAALVLAFAVYAGIAAVLTTAGEALLAHRTKNPYAHLTIGCALLSPSVLSRRSRPSSD